MAAKMAAKARDLFALCDAQGRGFATRADLQRLRHQLDGVDADQLQLVRPHRTTAPVLISAHQSYAPMTEMM